MAACRKVAVMSLVLFVLLLPQFAVADAPQQSGGGGGGGGGGGNAAITVYSVSPDQFVYTKSWDNSTQGFTFYYAAETEPYDCMLILDQQQASDPVSVDNGTQKTFYSKFALDEGQHEWLIYCDNSTSNGFSWPSYVSIDNRQPELLYIYPPDGGYVGSFASIWIEANGTGSPPDISSSLSAGTLLQPPSCYSYPFEFGFCSLLYDFSKLATGTVVDMNISLNDSVGNTNFLTGYSYIVDNAPPEITDNKGAPAGPVSDLAPLPLSANVSDNYQVNSVRMGVVDAVNSLLIFFDMNVADTNGLFGVNGTYDYAWFADGFDLSQGGSTAYQVSTYLDRKVVGDTIYRINGLFDREGDGNYAYAQATLYFDSNMELYGVDAPSIAIPFGEDVVKSGVSRFLVQNFDTFNQLPVNTSSIFTLYNYSDPIEKLNNPQLQKSLVPSGDYRARVEAHDSAGNMDFYQIDAEVDNTPPIVALSADKTVVNNAGNNADIPSPPITFTANVTDDNFLNAIAFVYGVSRNVSFYVIPYLQDPNPHTFTWNTQYYTLAGTSLLAYDVNSAVAVAGYLVPNTSEGTERMAYAFFDKTTGEFVKIASTGEENATPITLLDGLSTFEPIGYKGVGGYGDEDRSGKVLTANDSSGKFELTDASVAVSLVSALSASGSYTVYVYSFDTAGKATTANLSFTIDNSPKENPNCCGPSGGGGGGGGGGGSFIPANVTNSTGTKESAAGGAQPAQKSTTGVGVEPTSQPAPGSSPTTVNKTAQSSPTGMFAVGAGITSAITSMVQTITGFFGWLMHLFG